MFAAIFPGLFIFVGLNLIATDVKEEFDSLKENTNTFDNEILKDINIKIKEQIKEKNFFKQKNRWKNILRVVTNLINSILSDSSQTSSNLRTSETIFVEYCVRIRKIKWAWKSY